MKMYRAIIICAVFVISVSGLSGPYSCSSVNDCDCGSFCVDETTSLPCEDGPACICQQGCFVFDKFLEPSAESVEVYGNRCSCPDPVKSEGVAFCTFATWIGAPEGFEQIKNDNCGFQQPVQ